MKIAIIGCGYVCDYYLTMLKNYPELQVAGIMDCLKNRAMNLANKYSVPTYSNLDEILEDPQISIVVNLTNPKNHYMISKACLDAGKHVYSEKPLAMEFEQAKKLVELAENNNLLIASAPCTVSR